MDVNEMWMLWWFQTAKRALDGDRDALETIQIENQVRLEYNKPTLEEEITPQVEGLEVPQEALSILGELPKKENTMNNEVIYLTLNQEGRQFSVTILKIEAERMKEIVLRESEKGADWSQHEMDLFNKAHKELEEEGKLPENEQEIIDNAPTIIVQPK